MIKNTILPWYMFKKNMYCHGGNQKLWYNYGKCQNIHSITMVHVQKKAKHCQKHCITMVHVKKANFVKSMYNYFAYYAITMVNVQTTIVLP